MNCQNHEPVSLTAVHARIMIMYNGEDTIYPPQISQQQEEDFSTVFEM